MIINDLYQMKEKLKNKNKNRDEFIKITVNKTIFGVEKFNLI